jgi:hypothetical protein
MQAIHKTLVQKGSVQGLTITAELLPMHSPNSGVYVVLFSNLLHYSTLLRLSASGAAL